ncbi:mitochondrial carrier protein [Emiliania huxleyi CCMP1516]|uniref:Mitochondrial carrier protein n=2 Tax=Emiliania huxleyi TaxID=2903 RepID=A0A0D3JMB2_EMIH1|nr:mitochondrial carrier protein [Emiliania huxleyi CCMP1516]EOD24647.1 mitochondrial carrier protein [Emiliania huxleyi CCMP1516]|eukprot:XP_005777076.1 mitochondrial carrier protein [Emiliania huxleyi CCMP1516]
MSQTTAGSAVAATSRISFLFHRIGEVSSDRGETALKSREHTTSASITSWTSIKEKVLDLNDPTAFPAFGKSGGVESSREAAADEKLALGTGFMEYRYQELVGGMAAGLVQDALLHPLDVLRARLDTGVSSATARSAANPATALWCEAQSVAAVDGMRGLYRGYTLCLAASAPANALYFGSFKASQRALGDTSVPAAGRDFIAGLSAECVASLLWTPLDVLKQRMQVGPTDLGTLGATRDACRVGVVGLWRGYFAGLAVWGPFSASYFAMYEGLRRAMGSGDGATEASARQSIPAGLGAGAAAALLTQPLDCAKTRIQVGAVPRNLGLLSVMRRVYVQEGAESLWRGGAARTLWLTPGCAITITVFEAVERLLR